MRACVKMSVEVDNFLREVWGCVNLTTFIEFESFNVLVSQRKHYSSFFFFVCVCVYY